MDRLAERDTETFLVPLISVTPMTESPDMRHAVQSLAAGDYDWIALTSAAAVAALQQAADGLGMTLFMGGRTRVAAVGASRIAVVG